MDDKTTRLHGKHKWNNKKGNVSITLQEADTTYNHNIAIYYLSVLSSQTVED